jgi:prolyl-tRNA editing enzyme YbaK/EbsC (Cys-tRNA(Pro) deacylase)
LDRAHPARCQAAIGHTAWLAATPASWQVSAEISQEPAMIEASLPPATQRVAEAAARLKLTIDVAVHQAATRTAEEAAAACGCDVAQIVKSLVFRGKASGTPYLLLVSGRNRVDEARAGGIIGEALERPDAAFVREATGFAIGGIPPFGHARAIRTFADADLLAFDHVWAAAGTPNTVFAVSPRDLIAAIGASVIAVA